MKINSSVSVVIACGILAACGSTAPNTDKPMGAYLGGAEKISGDFGVETVDTRPSSGANLTGISCKNKLWEPAPTEAVAISVLKKQASAAGFNAVYINSVEQDPNAISKNCWSAIIATGVAFNK